MEGSEAGSGRATASAMTQVILQAGFPHVHRAIEVGADELTEDALGAAVKQELLLLVQAAWSRANRGRRTDRVAAIARELRSPG